MFNKTSRFLIALLLLPLCFAATLTIYELLHNLPDTAPDRIIAPELVALGGGYFAWLLIYFFQPTPMRIYIFGHELTHALWGILFGARIHKIKVKADGGYVQLSKSNMLITLAPYFFPFYTMLALLIRLAISFFLPMDNYAFIWLAIVGFTWGFHFTFTIQSLLIRQPDVMEFGRLFSYVIIFLLNAAGIGIWIVCTTTATLTDFSSTLVERTMYVYATAGNLIKQGAIALWQLFADR